MTNKVLKTKYLIIGNSAGGVAAAEAIRELDKPGEIIIVSDEPYPAYSRPLISEYLARRYPVEKMMFRPPDFYEKNNIRTLLGKKAQRLNVAEHVLELESGEEIAWEKLLLATGGSPIVPDIDGIGTKEVFTFTKIDDARAIDNFLSHRGREIRTVILGGGLIGVSVAEALAERGADVTIIEMKQRILNTILDEESSTLEEIALTGASIKIITGHMVNGISRRLPGEITGVSLDDARLIPCQLVVMAIGVRPRTDLTIGTGIKVNRGIVVDRHMTTSIPEIFACGDVAEAYDFIYDENRLTPIWPNAYMGGRVAGFNMAGAPVQYCGGTGMNSLKYFGLAVVSAGIVNPPDNSYEVISNRYGHAYRKVVLRDGRIVGMVFAGDIEKSGIIFSLMKERVEVERFKQSLVAENFGLAALPEEIWRARLEMPTSGFFPPVSVGEQPGALILEE